jgi:hypothetical protein
LERQRKEEFPNLTEIFVILKNESIQRGEALEYFSSQASTILEQMRNYFRIRTYFSSKSSLHYGNAL